MPAEPQRIQEIFLAAVEAADRSAVLDRECADDVDLRQRIETLLRAHDDVKDKPDVLPEQTAAYGSLVTATEQPGEIIAARYALVERIGEGGMGEVWVAKQNEPVKRKVALKLIKAGMDTKAVLQRFEAERQALALMDHPNIAKVHDGGMTPERRPFFVMELVNGLSLTKFCDEAKLGISKRLELFVAICRAVQHAHQKGIIHRDLKPSNILITVLDGRPIPKIIDFGVAKAVGGRLTDESLSTQFGAVVGTLEYMSPEQAGFSAADVDTRADIYSLGVILYELLTGLRPIDSTRLRQAALTEMIRIIREEEPSKPSTRLSTDASAPSLAALRHTEPKKLAALLRGELDWVVMKCLEKQRDRRYETANGLARDIERYLADEPVEARPPSAGYRMSKFIRRNKGPVLAASGIMLVLLAGIVGTSWGMWEAKQSAEAERLAKKDAQENEKRAVAAAEKERSARQEEERQRKFAEGINRFVVDDFLALTSVEGQDRFGGENKDVLSKDTTVQQLLDRAAERLRKRRDLDPRIEAELCWIIGVNYRGEGEANKSIEFLERAVHIRRDHFGPDHVDTLSAMNSLGLAFSAAGQDAKALPLLESALQGFEAKLGADHNDTIACRANLAFVYKSVGQLDKALPLLEAAVAASEAKLGVDHPETLRIRNNLATAYQATGQLEKAVRLFQATLVAYEAKLGTDHAETLATRNNLARAYQDAGQLNKALPLLEATLKVVEAKLGADHPYTLTNRNNLAGAYQAAGQFNKAVPLLEATLAAREAKLGAEHPDTLTSCNNLASAYQALGQFDKALPYCERAAAGIEKLDFQHVYAGRIIPRAIFAYEKAKQFEKAESLRCKWLAHVKEKSGAESPAYAAELSGLGGNLMQQRKFDDAEVTLRESLAIREAKEPAAWTTFNSKSMFGGAILEKAARASKGDNADACARAAGSFHEAEKLLLAGYEGMKTLQDRPAKAGGSPPKERMIEAAERLVQLYEAMDKPDDAAKWKKDLEAIKSSPAEKK